MDPNQDPSQQDPNQDPSLSDQTGGGDPSASDSSGAPPPIPDLSGNTSFDAPPPTQPSTDPFSSGGLGAVTSGYAAPTDPNTGAPQPSNPFGDPSGQLGGAPTSGGQLPAPGGTTGGGTTGGASAVQQQQVQPQQQQPLPPQSQGLWSQADFQAYMNYLNQQASVETNRYNQQFGLQQTQQNWLQSYQQQGLDIQKGIAAANQAYQQGMLATQNTGLAQQAARDAMTHDFQLQELAFRQQQNASNVEIEREKLDLQRRLLPASRVARRAATVQTI